MQNHKKHKAEAAFRLPRWIVETALPVATKMVYALSLAGRSTKQIAESLRISDRCVRLHKARLAERGYKCHARPYKPAAKSPPGSIQAGKDAGKDIQTCSSCRGELHRSQGIDYMGDHSRHRNRADCLYAVRAAKDAEIAKLKQQAVEIARGCRDYGGGYRSDDDKLAIYHHGMDTVERCLQAWANGDESHQLRVVQEIGKTELSIPPGEVKQCLSQD